MGALFPDPSNNRPVQQTNGRAIFKNTLPGCYVECAKRRLQHEDNADVVWGYILPQCWKQYYPHCGGHSASPVNIDSSVIVITGREKYHGDHGHEHDPYIKNTGYSLQVEYFTGYAVFSFGKYKILQYHFHFPSE